MRYYLMNTQQPMILSPNNKNIQWPCKPTFPCIKWGFPGHSLQWLVNMMKFVSNTDLRYFCAFSVDGGWTNWGSYSPCTKSCGGGTHFRERSCTNPRPANGGKTCIGTARESHSCNTNPCPTTPPPTTTTTPKTTPVPTTLAAGIPRHTTLQRYRIYVDTAP